MRSENEFNVKDVGGLVLPWEILSSLQKCIEYSSNGRVDP